MPEKSTKNAISLSSILSNFENLLSKTANDAPLAGGPAPAAIPAVTPADTAREVVVESAAAALASAQTAENKASDQIASAQMEKMQAVQVLKDLAKTAAEKEESAMLKEAGEFGRIFAQNFIEEVERNNMIKQASENAYDVTMQKIAESETTNIAKDAYLATLCKLAGANVYNDTNRIAVLGNDALGSEKFNMIMKEAYDATNEHIAGIQGK